MITERIKKQSGMSALLTIVIIGSAGLIMAKSISFLSLTELEMGDKENFGQKSLYNTEACLEDALLHMRENNIFAPSNKALQIASIDCQYSVNIDGSDRDVTAITQNSNYIRKIEVVASVSDGQVDVVTYKIE